SGFTFTAATSNQWLVTEVTSLVQGWLTSPVTNFGVALTSSSANVIFDSKEATTTSHEFELVIVLNSSSGASGPSGPTGAAGPSGAAGAPGPSGPEGPGGA